MKPLFCGLNQKTFRCHRNWAGGMVWSTMHRIKAEAFFRWSWLMQPWTIFQAEFCYFFSECQVLRLENSAHRIHQVEAWCADDQLSEYGRQGAMSKGWLHNLKTNYNFGYREKSNSPGSTNHGNSAIYLQNRSTLFHTAQVGIMWPLSAQQETIVLRKNDSVFYQL